MFIVTYTYSKRGENEPRLLLRTFNTEREAVIWLLASLCFDDPHEIVLRAGRKDAENGNLDEAYQALDEYTKDCINNNDVMFSWIIRQ